MTTNAYQEAVNKLMGYIDQTVNFAKGELPEVCKEILAYGAAQSHFWCWFSGIFAVIAAVIFVLTFIAANKDNEYGASIFMLIATFGLSTLCGCNMMEAKKIELAPKLYVLEFFKSALPTK